MSHDPTGSLADITQPGERPFVIDFICQSSMGRSEGGMETWAYQFVPGLLRSYPTARVRLYGLLQDGRTDPTDEFLNAVAPHQGRFSTRFFRAARGRVPLMVSMIRQFRREKDAPLALPADISIAAGSVVELLAVLSSRRARRTFKIAWLRTMWVDQKSYRIPSFLMGLVRWLELQALQRADLVLCNGDDIAARYGERGLKVHVVKNAVDTERWAAPPPAIRRPLRIAYVGRFAVDKGAPQFVDLAGRLASQPDAADFRFEAFGHLGDEAMISAAAERGELHWHGAVPNAELPAALSEIDVCVALTFSALKAGGGGTSNAMMEQLASGRITLAWDNAIFRQWLHTDNAYLVPQGDLDGLIEALRAIVADPIEARRRAINGTSTVANCGVGAMMRRFDTVVRAAFIAAGRAVPEPFTLYLPESTIS